MKTRSDADVEFQVRFFRTPKRVQGPAAVTFSDPYRPDPDLRQFSDSDYESASEKD